MQQNPTGRFSGLAETYARCRPSYPADAIDFIVAMSGLDSKGFIVDVGCGTGISSRIFAERGYRVLGVEPNDDMRSKAEEARQSEPGATAALLTYTKGTAEATTVQTATADLVLSAQAFHWFDQTKALPEFHRILKIGGWLALMWNERDESDQFTSKYGDIFRTARETAGVEGPRLKAGNALLDSDLFEHKQRDLFVSSQELDEEGLVGRAFSASYAPKENPEKDRFDKALRALFHQYAKNSKTCGQPMVTLHYATAIYSGRRRDRG